jgi:hypothetical protein
MSARRRDMGYGLTDYRSAPRQSQPFELEPRLRCPSDYRRAGRGRGAVVSVVPGPAVGGRSCRQVEEPVPDRHEDCGTTGGQENK